MAHWASQFEGEHGATELVGLAVDSRGDVALAGHVFEEGGGFVDGRKDAIAMKLASSDGSTLWTRKIGVSGSHDWSSAVAADRIGNIFVGGQTDGSLFRPAAGDGQDIWVAKLDGVGDLLWGYQVGSMGQDVSSTLTVDSASPDGDVVVCGSTSGGLFSDPESVADEGVSAAQSEGLGVGMGTKGTEAFCAKLSTTDGHVMWGTRLKGGLNDGILAAAVDPLTGDVFATGYTAATGGSDFMVVRLSGLDGSEKWRSTGGGGWTRADNADSRVRDSACALAVDGRGDVIIAGNTEGALFDTTAAGQETDAFVAKLDGRNGTRLWGWQGGSVGNDYANDVAVDPSGNVYACGAAPLGMFADEESATPAEAGVGAGVGAAAAAAAAEQEQGVEQAGGLWGDRARDAPVADMFVAKLDGRSGSLIWGEQFGSGADDEAVGLMLGPDPSAAAANAKQSVGALEQQDGEGTALYLTGWTRGALFSQVPARWQDGWAVKLPNPPPKTLGVSSGRVDPSPMMGGPGGAGAGVPRQGAVERGAITAGLVRSVTGMLVVASLGLYFVLRKNSNAGGVLSATRHDSAKDSDNTKGLFRRRGRPNLHDSGGKGSGGGGSAQDGVELSLLSDGADGGRTSPLSTRHGGGAGSGGGAIGARRDTNPPTGGPQATFYL